MKPSTLVNRNRDFERLYVFGTGGFGREVAWLAEQAWGDEIEIRFAVDAAHYTTPSVNGFVVVSFDDLEPDSQSRLVIAVGDPGARRRIAQKCAELGMEAVAIVHPRAEVSRWVKIGRGTIVCAGVIATTNIEIGEHVHVNLDCTIGHDVRIGEYSVLSPGVHVSGNVVLGRGTFIGTGATIVNGSPDQPLIVADGAVVGAGACVTRPVEPGALVVGVPAQRKR